MTIEEQSILSNQSSFHNSVRAVISKKILTEKNQLGDVPYLGHSPSKDDMAIYNDYNERQQKIIKQEAAVSGKNVNQANLNNTLAAAWLGNEGLEVDKISDSDIEDAVNAIW